MKSTSNLRKAGKDKTGWLKPDGSLWQKSRGFKGRPEGEVNQGWLQILKVEEVMMEFPWVCSKTRIYHDHP